MQDDCICHFNKKKNMMDKLAVEDTFKGFLGFFKSMGAFDYRTDLFFCPCISDIDECTSGNNCTSPATCSNTDGSYACVCPSGYTKSGQYGCSGMSHHKEIFHLK